MSTEQTVATYSLALKAAAEVVVVASGKQSYTSTTGSLPWQLALYGNNQLVKAIGGATAYTDTPVLQAMFTVSGPTTIPLKLTWFGASAITLEAGCAMTIIISYK